MLLFHDKVFSFALTQARMRALEASTWKIGRDAA
jgi:hypothetical protein